jgi:hypothetical protein
MAWLAQLLTFNNIYSGRVCEKNQQNKLKSRAHQLLLWHSQGYDKVSGTLPFKMFSPGQKVLSRLA